MLTIWATVVKELTELRRNRAGLMMLLVMPMALVLVLSLVQDNIMRATGESPLRVLFVDSDNSFLGQAIGTRLGDAGGLELVRKVQGADATEETARAAVARGDFQFCIVVSRGTGAAFRTRIRKSAENSFRTTGKGPTNAAAPAPVAGLTVYFDPAVQGAFRTAVTNALERAILGIELREKGAVLAETFTRQMKRAVAEKMTRYPGFPVDTAVPDVRFRLDTDPVLGLAEAAAVTDRMSRRPTAAQQNVPAWALFGMFFIVVPLSGALVRERQSGTFRRLMTLPVSAAGLLAGKVVAYVLVCLAQCALMFVAGMFVLPLLGTSALALGPALPAVALVALASALAATGYGILVGTLSKSYEQASMFGAVSIVIAAALGGIMVPVYVMPRFMREISVYSPLAWGLNAFQDLLVRGTEPGAVAQEISYLLIFSVLTLTIAWLSLRGNGSR